MSTIVRRLFLCIIGIIAGLAAWPVAEISLMFQESFTTYLVFNIFLGIIFGIIMGGFFGSGDGILTSVKSHIFKGMIHGAIIGIAGGICGFLIGQACLFVVGEMFIHSMKSFNTIGFPISRAIGWAVLGVFVGMGDGIRSRSFDKIKVGIIGGISGGFLGGLALEYLRLLLPNIMFARLVGLIIFGCFIGLFYGFIENKLSFGVLRLLNGKYKGKEFIINQRKMRIGVSKKNDIVLEEYTKIADIHAELKYKKDELIIKTIDTKKPVIVNDDKIKEHHLKFEDVIQIGTAKLFYKFG